MTEASEAHSESDEGAFAVDLRRCIGCHACSVACKTAHDVPLGEFRLRVRWLPRPTNGTYAFVPVFSESLCRADPASTAAGMVPACVRACPTGALAFAGAAVRTDNFAAVYEHPSARPLEAPEADDLKRGVRYLGAEDWFADKLYRGAELDRRDEDPIYEQR